MYEGLDLLFERAAVSNACAAADKDLDGAGGSGMVPIC
jgi:hypothetical protein|tara:strand:- start:119 stop:232 length:114 start_codon:yes stop_codon:yes gene_type:complete